MDSYINEIEEWWNPRLLYLEASLRATDLYPVVSIIKDYILPAIAPSVPYIGAAEGTCGAHFNDLKEGLWIGIFPSGNIESKGYYSRGLLHGTMTSWNDDEENGSKLDQTTQYNNGVKEGNNIKYYSSGRIHSILIYHEDNLISGTTYHGNDQMWCEEFYLNNLRHGKRTMWYDNGKIWMVQNCQNGKFHGTATSWDENGNINKIINYVNGERQ